MERLLATIETGWATLAGDPRTWLQLEIGWTVLGLDILVPRRN